MRGDLQSSVKQTVGKVRPAENPFQSRKEAEPPLEDPSCRQGRGQAARPPDGLVVGIVAVSHEVVAAAICLDAPLCISREHVCIQCRISRLRRQNIGLAGHEGLPTTLPACAEEVAQAN